jgi:hypothetical protein
MRGRYREPTDSEPAAFLGQGGDSRPNLVADLANDFDRLPFGIAQRPVQFPEAWNIAARIATSHRNQ